ncbi:MAG TPA: bifunctional adenosylcobinamide kinase/adenosylcobinamide-phosphate guanylyltransferase [Oscillospiraceae bacterium]|nr:bifunctional adenosylcobinamide kinase/adenosylcobinamide-phosphate guanylyltransferase [Oscillospiraceae bacterium]
MVVVVYGGSACGKSAFAEKTAMELSGEKRVYIATMRITDEECVHRVERHRAMRAQKGFSTVEAPRDLAEVVLREVPAGSTVLLECLGNLTANELFVHEGGGDPEAAVKRVEDGLVALFEKAENAVIVANDVFSDGVEYEALTELYIRCLAQVTRYAVAGADSVYQMICGIPVWKKGAAL